MEKYAIPLACEGEWDGQSGITYQEVKGDRFTMLSSIPTDQQQEPAEWDFAIHRFDVRTNNGAVSRTTLKNIDNVQTLDTGELDFTPDTWSESRVVVDLSDMMAYRIGYQKICSNQVLSEWVRIDISCPPPAFETTDLVYVIRLSDGTMCAVKMDNYINAQGEKGYLTIDIVYPL